jgi:hypothetical protein
MTDPRVQQAIELMTRFARRTGLEPLGEQRRYLWTDAFAVTNFWGLAARTGASRYGDLALRLVDLVHHTLGRHRSGDRQGWISGLAEPEGEMHPTAGGLRIGKTLDERRPDEPQDPRLEWDRDGQYFHYLTKWMHALDQTTRATGDARFNCWARELAAVAHQAFVYTPQRMYWKMSVDLSRPLVASMGQHDPLDGLVTYLQLQATNHGSCSAPPLNSAIAELEAMVIAERLATDDPLGIGGLLFDAYRLARLRQPTELLEAVLVAALGGVRQYSHQPDLRAPANMRLAFRELGLAVGLAGMESLMVEAGPNMRPVVDELGRFAPLRDALETFWLRDEHQQSQTWQAHADINEVMLATSLVPHGFLMLTPVMGPVSVLNHS